LFKGKGQEGIKKGRKEAEAFSLRGEKPRDRSRARRRKENVERERKEKGRKENVFTILNLGGGRSHDESLKPARRSGGGKTAKVPERERRRAKRLLKKSARQVFTVVFVGKELKEYFGKSKEKDYLYYLQRLTEKGS